MIHHRQRVRDAIAAVLAPIAPVTSNRTDPLQGGELPCITLHTRSEVVEEVNLRRRQKRTMDLFVDAYAKAGDGLDDALDGMAAGIEAALAGAPKLGGLVERISLADTLTDLLREGETPAGVARLHFVVTYGTEFGAPGA